VIHEAAEATKMGVGDSVQLNINSRARSFVIILSDIRELESQICGRGWTSRKSSRSGSLLKRRDKADIGAAASAGILVRWRRSTSLTTLHPSPCAVLCILLLRESRSIGPEFAPRKGQEKSTPCFSSGFGCWRCRKSRFPTRSP
jgi:hypothetical protein